MGESAPSGLERLRRAVDPIFGADLRSLALFRIALASVLLWDLFDRSKSVAAHYGDPGTVPVSVLPLITGGAKFSVHVWLADSIAAQWGLLALAVVAALALLVGWRTRIAGALSWYLLMSIQIRNPLISWEGADQLLRVLLFWSLFAPVGARLSLDARRRAEEVANWLCSPATALFVIQVCALYWLTGMEKTGAAWQDGQALAHVMRFGYFGAPLAPWMTQFDGLLEFLSHATLQLELFGCFLLLVPWKTWILRLLVMTAFYGFHLGVLATMSVGYFSFISMVAWLPLLPSQLFDRSAAHRPEEGARPRLRTPVLLEASAAVFLLFLVTSIGLKTARFATGDSVRAPAPFHAFGRLFRIQQNWPMFSPDAPRFDFWPVLRGRLSDSRQVDPFRGGPVRSTQPERVDDYFPSFKWKIHFAGLAVRAPEPTLPHPLWSNLIGHLCDRWNGSHEPGERLVRVAVELNLVPIRPRHGPQRWESRPLGSHACPRHSLPRP